MIAIQTICVVTGIPEANGAPGIIIVTHRQAGADMDSAPATGTDAAA